MRLRAVLGIILLGLLPLVVTDLQLNPRFQHAKLLPDEKLTLSGTSDEILLETKTKVDQGENSERARDNIKVCRSKPCQAASDRIMKSMNTNASPCTDFYQFACGGFIKENPVEVISINKEDQKILLYMDGMTFDIAYDSVQAILESKTDQYLSNATTSYRECLLKKGEVNKRKCVIEATKKYTLELGVAYAKKDPQENTIKDVKSLVDTMKNEWAILIDKNDWMDKISKEHSKNRARDTESYVGYDKSFLTPWELPKNEKFNPLLMNAQYMFFNGENSIFVPLSIFNPPFFKQDMDALNYGGLGLLINHELSHLHNKYTFTIDAVTEVIWTQSTIEAFRERRNCFVNQYYQAFKEFVTIRTKDMKNRSLSVGRESVEENTADSGGLRVAFNAYQRKKPNYDKLINLENYNHKQLFFLAFANVFCSSESVEYTEESILTTVEKNKKHSPSQFRVNEPLKNMKEFAELCLYLKMDDKEVLRLTKRKLKTMKLKKNGLSLENVAVRVIIRNLIDYAKFPDKKDSLRKLPRVLREKLLQEMLRRKCIKGVRTEEKFKALMELFPILLSSRTRSIELNGILSYSPNRYNYHSFEETLTYCEELLYSAATLAPNINELIIQRNHAIKMTIEPQHRTLRMLEMMSKMLNLNRLFVELYSFEVADILNLCKNIPNLQFLNVRLNDARIHASAEDIKSSLFNVKEFIFEPNAGYDMLQWLRILCIQNLPNIEVVQFYCNVGTRINMDWILSSDKIISSLGFTETSNLRNLYVNVSEPDFEFMDSLPKMFPNITDLMVRKKNNRNQILESMYGFSKIKCLHFLEIGDLNIQQRFWQAYGGNLQTLVLSQEYDERFVDLNPIFNQCPNLEKIVLQNVNVEPKKIECFAELKEFEWIFREISGVVGKMDLSSILVAPKLEILSIDGWNFDKAGIRKVISMIQNKEILAQLHTFQLHSHHPVREGVNYEDFELRDLLVDLVKSSSAFLPKLTNVKFFSSNDKYVDLGFTCTGFGWDPFGIEEDSNKNKDPFMVYDKYQDDDIYADDFMVRLMDLFQIVSQLYLQKL
ncbi:Hypothetical predicted protein [Cloeon dipterum]|uniref:Peptidase M13 C-terminal domain-containing protein n=1 Tax=Cloeon dipterum TaxID=197152 RepID=A0A8S1E5D5_9INSE|nr:Hypothetical predicted protein [Cloeon dipterum]